MTIVVVVLEPSRVDGDSLVVVVSGNERVGERGKDKQEEHAL